MYKIAEDGKVKMRVPNERRGSQRYVAPEVSIPIPYSLANAQTVPRFSAGGIGARNTERTTIDSANCPRVSKYAPERNDEKVGACLQAFTAF